MHRHRVLSLALFLLVAVSADAQVTTATLVGLVRDNSAAVIPGANVVATHEGTGVARESVSDANGEFVLAALPSGPYTVRIELSGFKTINQRGIQLGAGQTLRQSFTLEVGAMSETVNVTGEAPLVETAMSLQADSLGTQEVRELPVNRRNLTNLIPSLDNHDSQDSKQRGNCCAHCESARVVKQQIDAYPAVVLYRPLV